MPLAGSVGGIGGGGGGGGGGELRFGPAAGGKRTAVERPGSGVGPNGSPSRAVSNAASVEPL